MDSPDTNEFSDGKSLELDGVRILVVEDSWQIGVAVASLLKACGADVSGPVATCADAQRLALEQMPDAALVDFSLREGERADGLVNELHDQGVYVVVMTGYPILPIELRQAAAILDKPLHEAQLIGSLRQVITHKAQRKEYERYSLGATSNEG